MEPFTACQETNGTLFPVIFPIGNHVLSCIVYLYRATKLTRLQTVYNYIARRRKLNEFI